MKKIASQLITDNIIQPIELTRHIETAHRVFGIISQVFCYGIAKGDIDRDITARFVLALIPHSKTKRFAALTNEKDISVFP